MRNITRLTECLKGVRTVAITGHVRPDGDCIGACMALWHYLRDNYPEIEAQVFLESVPERFAYLPGTEQVACQPDGRSFDLFAALDCSDTERFAPFMRYYETAGKRLCVDHHVSNRGLGDFYWIEPEASSCCEVLFGLMEPEKIGLSAAQALYTGIVHDTGVFQYSNTTPKTLRTAAILLEKGVDFAAIIEDSFFQKTYLQNQILGRALMESMLICDHKVIVSALRQKDMEFYGVGPEDLEGIVSQLRLTRGVEVAIFLYETAIAQFKVSMRSKEVVDVSKIAVYYGGGGHKRAAGCTMQGMVHDVVNNLTLHISRQLEGRPED